MEFNTYLQRLQIDKQSTPNIVYLQKLLLHHMYHIPIENIDVMRRNRIALEINHLYHKIVQLERGGLSYELNGLFSWLLNELGYNVHLISGRLPISENAYGPDFDHMAMIVHLEKDYLVDIGCTEFIRSPLPLTGDAITNNSGSFRIDSSTTAPSLYRVQKMKNDQWITLYSFENKPQELHYFQARCWYHQSSSQSYYMQKTMAFKATDTGSISLVGDKLITVQDGVEEVKEITSLKEQLYLLHSHFSISHSSLLQR